MNNLLYANIVLAVLCSGLVIVVIKQAIHANSLSEHIDTLNYRIEQLHRMNGR